MKSLVSTLDSQQVSRTNTPTEQIVRSPSPDFAPPAPESPITGTEGDDENEAVDKSEFKGGEVFDPRISVVLEKLAGAEAQLEEMTVKLVNVEKNEASLKEKIELLEVLNDCPTEIKKTLRKELGENVTQLTNQIRQLELKMDSSSKDAQQSKSGKLNLLSSETSDWFKNKFKIELASAESKNKVKTWIQCEQSSYQVSKYRVIDF